MSFFSFKPTDELLVLDLDEFLLSRVGTDFTLSEIEKPSQNTEPYSGESKTSKKIPIFPEERLLPRRPRIEEHKRHLLRKKKPQESNRTLFLPNSSAILPPYSSGSGTFSPEWQRNISPKNTLEMPNMSPQLSPFSLNGSQFLPMESPKEKAITFPTIVFPGVCHQVKDQNCNNSHEVLLFIVKHNNSPIAKQNKTVLKHTTKPILQLPEFNLKKAASMNAIQPSKNEQQQGKDARQPRRTKLTKASQINAPEEKEAKENSCRDNYLMGECHGQIQTTIEDDNKDRKNESETGFLRGIFSRLTGSRQLAFVPHPPLYGRAASSVQQIQARRRRLASVRRSGLSSSDASSNRDMVKLRSLAKRFGEEHLHEINKGI